MRRGRDERGAAEAHLPLLPSESVDQAVETYGLQKITLLREISLKTGVQVGTGQTVPPVPRLPQGPQGRCWGAHSPHMVAGWEVLAIGAWG